MKKGVLGRGLDAIFMDNSAPEESGRNVSLIRVSNIEPRADQPRRTFDEEALAELAQSIAENGILQPIAVRPAENGFYEIIAGERRWRAAKKAALAEIPAIVLNIDDRKAAELALIENVQREDLSALEEAMAYRSLIGEYGLTQEETARRIGKSRSAVANTLRLLELPEHTLGLLSQKALSSGHARALLGLTDRELVDKIADEVVKSGLSVREVEALVRKMNAPEKKMPEKKEIRVDYVKDLERRLQKSLGRRVRICNTQKKKHVQIEFSDNADLDALLEILLDESTARKL